MAVGKMRNAESKIWDPKCGMTLIGRGDKPGDRCHSADHHTNLSTGNAVKCRPAVRKMLATTPESVFDYDCNLIVQTYYAFSKEFGLPEFLSTKDWWNAATCEYLKSKLSYSI